MCMNASEMPQASNSRWLDDLPKWLIKQQNSASSLVRASLQLHQMISGVIIIMLFFPLIYFCSGACAKCERLSLFLSRSVSVSFSLSDRLFNVYADNYFLSSSFLARPALQSCLACEIPSLMLMVASIKCAQSDWNI